MNLNCDHGTKMFSRVLSCKVRCYDKSRYDLAFITHWANSADDQLDDIFSYLPETRI